MKINYFQDQLNLQLVTVSAHLHMELQLKTVIEPLCELAHRIRGHPHLNSQHWQCWVGILFFTLKRKIEILHCDDCGTEEHLG